MSQGTVAPYVPFVGIDDDGSLLVGGLLYTYIAGTSTPQATYSDVYMLVPNSNPIVLDGAGRCEMFWSAASYKLVMKRSDGSTVWTRDNVAATGLGATASLGEIFGLDGDPDSPITDAAYPSGATYDKLAPGSAIFNIDSANLPGTYCLELMMMAVGVITVTAALVNLTDGAPDTPIATCASTSTVGERVRSTAITFATGGAAKDYGLKVKVSAGSGYIWGARIVRTA